MKTNGSMTNGEIVADYKQAKDKKKQIAILADLNGCKEEDIREILKNGGIDGRSLPRQGEKKKKEDAPAQESAAPEAGVALAGAGTPEGEGVLDAAKWLLIEGRELLDALMDIYLLNGYGVLVRPVKGREAWIVGALLAMEEET